MNRFLAGAEGIRDELFLFFALNSSISLPSLNRLLTTFEDVNPNKAELFEASFFWGRERFNLNPP